MLISAISKGGFAGATSNIMVPIMALVLPVPQVAAIALILLCTMDLSGLRAWWGQWDRQEMRVLLPGGVVGVAMGGVLFAWLSPRTVMGVLGVITLSFLAYRAVQGWRRARPPTPHSAPRGFIAAMGSGITSTLAHAGAPPLQMYLLPRAMPRALFAATNVVFFGVINYVKLVPYAMLGLFDWTNIGTALVLLPLCPLGVYLGIWLQKRVPDAAFYRIVSVLLLVTGCKLVWDGFFA